jgi:hypothetical protein
MSGAFSGDLSFLISWSRIGLSLTGVPSGDVAREFGCLLGLLGVTAGFASGAVTEEGLTAGAGFSPRSFLDFTGGVVTGLAAGLTGAAGGIGEGFSKRLSLAFGLSGVIAGLAGAAVAAGLATAGLPAAAGDVPGAGATGEALAGFAAASALSRGLTLGGGTFLGSSLFIFCFKSA